MANGEKKIFCVEEKLKNSNRKYVVWEFAYSCALPCPRKDLPRETTWNTHTHTPTNCRDTIVRILCSTWNLHNSTWVGHIIHGLSRITNKYQSFALKFFVSGIKRMRVLAVDVVRSFEPIHSVLWSSFHNEFRGTIWLLSLFFAYELRSRIVGIPSTQLQRRTQYTHFVYKV